MVSARGPVSEAGAAAGGCFSRQAGTQGKAKILRTLLGGSFWDTCGFDDKANVKGRLASEPSAAEALDHQPPAPLIWPFGVQVMAGSHWFCLTSLASEAQILV